MGARYSDDLPRKVIQTCERKRESQRQIAELFSVSISFVESLYLPPYSPDWSSIEPCWSAIKTRLRGMKARTRQALDQALAKIVPTVSNSDARGWFAHCGYASH